jgi:hypothetical protein
LFEVTVERGTSHALASGLFGYRDRDRDRCAAKIFHLRKQ